MKLLALLMVAVLALGFCAGICYGQRLCQLEKVFVEVYIYQPPERIIDTVIIEKEIRVEVPVCRIRQFPSREALSKWQSRNQIEGREGWGCVDYALLMQLKALLEGWQMSTELLIDGKTGHCICSSWIGDECIYLEPQGFRSWIGGERGEK